MSIEFRASVGDTIEVFWPEDETYYIGRVTGFKKNSGHHRLEYFDGDIENLNLNNEIWRLVSKDTPKGVTASHIGSILKKAAVGTLSIRLRKTIEKRKSSIPSSPVSVAEVPLHETCACCIRSYSPMSARLLLAHIATRWLRDESRRPSTPVKTHMKASWGQVCADLCVHYVHDKLHRFVYDSAKSIENHVDADAEVGWMMDVCDEESLELALGNYRAWSRPLSFDERNIEKDIMRAVALRFAPSALSKVSDSRESILEEAQLQAATALRGKLKL